MYESKNVEQVVNWKEIFKEHEDDETTKSSKAVKEKKKEIAIKKRTKQPKGRSVCKNDFPHTFFLISFPNIFHTLC